MSINLRKGERINLAKTSPNLRKAIIGVGWDTAKYVGSQDFDLDASAFVLDERNRCRDDRDFVFYNNLNHYSGAIQHTGDNRTGEGDGDDEQLIIDFSKMPSYVKKIGIAVTIHDAQDRSQNFGQVSNSFVRLVNAETNEEILKFDLGDRYSTQDALVFCEIYLQDGEWRFNAVGDGFSGGLADLCTNYGLEVG